MNLKRGHVRFGFYEKSRKGLSAVITVLIIILLAVVLIGVVWVTTKGLAESGVGQTELGQRCLEIDFSSVSVSPVEDQPGDYSITLSRTPRGDKIAGIKLVLFNKTINTNVLEFGTSMGAFDTKTKIIDAGIIGANRIDITPYFTGDSGKEEVCQQTRSFFIDSSGLVLSSDGGDGGDGSPPAGESGSTCSSDSDCDAGFKCEAGSCVSVCDGTWEAGYFAEGIYECDGTDVYGCDLNQCVCKTGFSHDGGNGGCTLNPPILTGTINSVWLEEGNANRFKSEDLPKTQTELIGYTSYYVDFEESAETQCFGISSAWYYVDLDISEVGLNIPVGDSLAEIYPSEKYNIWEAENCGQ